MQNTVICKKYGEELEALEQPPMPGPVGEKLQQEVSKKAWNEWLAIQTMLINEKHLSLIQKEAREYLHEQRERFFNNLPIDRAEGYTPPDNDN